jgi:hypothetical protein
MNRNRAVRRQSNGGLKSDHSDMGSKRAKPLPTMGHMQPDHNMSDVGADTSKKPVHVVKRSPRFTTRRRDSIGVVGQFQERNNDKNDKAVTESPYGYREEAKATTTKDHDYGYNDVDPIPTPNFDLAKSRDRQSRRRSSMPHNLGIAMDSDNANRLSDFFNNDTKAGGQRNEEFGAQTVFTVPTAPNSERDWSPLANRSCYSVPVSSDVKTQKISSRRHRYKLTPSSANSYGDDTKKMKDGSEGSLSAGSPSVRRRDRRKSIGGADHSSKEKHSSRERSGSPFGRRDQRRSIGSSDHSSRGNSRERSSSPSGRRGKRNSIDGFDRSSGRRHGSRERSGSPDRRRQSGSRGHHHSSPRAEDDSKQDGRVSRRSGSPRPGPRRRGSLGEADESDYGMRRTEGGSPTRMSRRRGSLGAVGVPDQARRRSERSGSPRRGGYSRQRSGSPVGRRSGRSGSPVGRIRPTEATTGVRAVQKADLATRHRRTGSPRPSGYSRQRSGSPVGQRSGRSGSPVGRKRQTWAGTNVVEKADLVADHHDGAKFRVRHSRRASLF